MINIDKYIAQHEQSFGKLGGSYRIGLASILDSINSSHSLIQDLRLTAYFLATIKHEVADTWLPIRERGTKQYFIDRYWLNKKIRKQLGNLSESDAYTFCGRGYVQLTGRRNYSLFGKYAHVDLLSHPEEACNPHSAFLIARTGMIDGLFTGKRLSNYINADCCDFENARRVVNGTDRADLIANYATRIHDILLKIS